MSKINRKIRMVAFDAFKSLIVNKLSRKVIIDKINTEFDIPRGTLYDWYKGKHIPWGRAGKVVHQVEIFYVIGALLGDGCLYKWKPTNNYVILIGDKKFTAKYAKYLRICTNKKTRPYIDRNKNIWFVRTNNFELYELFKKTRINLAYLEHLITKNGRRAALLFVEGFFDAEGCVKLIKESSRMTPKVCLDITNANKELLDLVLNLFVRYLNIYGRFSSQKPSVNRKTSHHLRIYRKNDIRKFLRLVHTTKLKANKAILVKNWLKQ